jgi:hypothetical protein
MLTRTRKAAAHAAKKVKRVAQPTAPPRSLVKFFAESPLPGSGVNLERKSDHGRKVKL